MRQTFVSSEILQKATNQGWSTQYHVVLNPEDGAPVMLWMKDTDYIDWIEDPIALFGTSCSFDPATYQLFSNF